VVVIGWDKRGEQILSGLVRSSRGVVEEVLQVNVVGRVVFVNTRGWRDGNLDSGWKVMVYIALLGARAYFLFGKVLDFLGGMRGKK